MVFWKSCVVLVIVSVVAANPTEEKRSYKLSGDVEVASNGHQPQSEARGGNSLEDTLLGYVQSHDVTVKLPLDTAATVSARDINDGVMNFKVKLSSSEVDEGRGKKKKIKKVAFPIVALLLLKAITLIPLILGVLGVKTWKALNLGFITLLTSFGMAVYEFTKKFTADKPASIITHIAHGHDHHDHHDYHDHHDHHWDHHHNDYHNDYHRSLDTNTQQMAYNAY